MVRALAWPVQRAPYWMLRLVARIVGPLIYLLGGRHRRRVILQMRLVFGGTKSEKEIARLARESFVHLVMFTLETLCIVRIKPARLPQYYSHERIEAFRAKVQGPCFLITAHLGGFQHAPNALALVEGYKVMTVQRPLDNPDMDALLQEQRGTNNVESLSKFESFLSLRRYIRGGYVICLVMDQNGGKRGAFADFLGFKASTWTSAAELHYLFKIPLHIATAHRVGLGPALDLRATATWPYDEAKGRRYRDEPSAREELHLEIVEWMNAALSQGILEAPEQWLWQHRRWKTRPKGENIPLVDGVPCPWLPATSAEVAATEVATDD